MVKKSRDDYSKLTPRLRDLLDSEALPIRNYRGLSYEHPAETYMAQIYKVILETKHDFTPKGENDDKLLKETIMNEIKKEPLVTKMVLRYLRS